MINKTKNKNSSLLFNFYMILGMLQAAIIVLWAFALIWLSQQEGDTAMGAGLVLALVYPLFLAIACVFALIAVIGLSIYMLRRKPQGKRRMWSLVVMAISLIPIGFGLFLTYHTTVVYPAERQRLEQEQLDAEQKATQEELELERQIEELRLNRGDY